jgi:hypothetical protein
MTCSRSHSSQVDRPGPYSQSSLGHFCCLRPLLPAFFTSLVPVPELQAKLPRAEKQELFYILANRVSERRALSSSARKESNLAFTVMVIGHTLWDLLVFINTAVWGLGSRTGFWAPWGPWLHSHSLQSSTELQAAIRTWWARDQGVQGGFSGSSDSSCQGYLGTWLYFSASVPVAGFIKLIVSHWPDCCEGSQEALGRA